MGMGHEGKEKPQRKHWGPVYLNGMHKRVFFFFLNEVTWKDLALCWRISHQTGVR